MTYDEAATAALDLQDQVRERELQEFRARKHHVLARLKAENKIKPKTMGFVDGKLEFL